MLPLLFLPLLLRIELLLLPLVVLLPLLVLLLLALLLLALPLQLLALLLLLLPLLVAVFHRATGWRSIVSQINNCVELTSIQSPSTLCSTNSANYFSLSPHQEENERARTCARARERGR